MIYLYLAIGSAVQFIYIGLLCIAIRNEPYDIFDFVRMTGLKIFGVKTLFL